MKVRDLREYVRKISSGKETLDLLGKDSENFLQLMYGQGQTVRSLIVGAASFANNASEQLFYEFVQNAYDADADSLFFYANEKYLIVLNNGKPFYTDFDIFSENQHPREGQLYNFLAKGKSQKLIDESKLGKYGQGSKLLYTLIADSNAFGNTEKQLIEAIVNNKKGPYIISWENKAQLDALLINGDNWESARADNFEDNILFAKILMSYYPIAAGQALEFFSNEEAQDVIRAFEELVDPPRNISFLTRGTAIVVPLGEGMYDAITNEKNLSNVRERLGGFSSITADKKQNQGRYLNHIYVMNQEVSKHHVKSVFLEFNEEGTDFCFHFAFNPELAEENAVNLFKGLPILQTKYHLGFIVDSQNWEVDDSRQRLTNIDKSCEQFKLALSHLIEKLPKLLATNREKFDYIYQSILSSCPKEYSEEEIKIKEVFYQKMRPFLYKYMRTTLNEYVPFENTCVAEKPLDVELSTLGILNLHWIKADDYSRHLDKELRIYKFSEMLHDADKEKLSKWILGMSREEYRKFHQYCLECLDDIHDIPIFRTNHNKLRSLDELHSTTNVYYRSTDSGELFTEQECVLEPITEDLKEYCSYLMGKIQENLTVLRSSSLNRDALCNILTFIADKCPDYQEQIKNNFPVLQNLNGHYLPFSDLLTQRPKETTLYDGFVVMGALPRSLQGRDWFADTSSNPLTLWKWVVAHFDDIKRLSNWRGCTNLYISDIKKVFKGTKGDGESINLNLDNDGVPTENQTYVIENIDRLTKNEYEKLMVAFKTGYLVPFQYYEVLSEAPFRLSSLSFNELINGIGTMDFDTLEVLSKVSNTMLNDYRINQNGELFTLSNLENGSNYINVVNEDLRNVLTKLDCYFLPKRVHSLIKGDKSGYDLHTPEFAKWIIELLDEDDLLDFYPIICDCNAETIDLFFNRLKNCELGIDSKIQADAVIWKIIKLAGKNKQTRENLLNALRYKDTRLPETIVKNTISVYGKDFDIYDLDIHYKEENTVLESFLECLPSSEDALWFKDKFFKDKQEEVEAADLYNDLEDTYLSIEQLRFCLAYLFENEEISDTVNLEISDKESLEMALNMIVQEEYTGFDKYFSIDGFDPNVQVYAELALLHEEERLPNILHKWLSSNPTHSDFFTKLRTEDNDDYILIRKNIRTNKCKDIDGELNDEVKLASTLEWLKNQDYMYVYRSNRYNMAMKLIDVIPADYETPFFLRYTGKVEDKEEFHPCFKLEEYNVDSYFLDSRSWKPTFKEILKTRDEVQNFFRENIVYIYENDQLLRTGIYKPSRLKFQIKPSNDDYVEFKDDVYDKWKSLPESNGIRIMTSSKPISLNFAISSNDKRILSVGLANRDCGYDDDKTVIVRYPNTENITIMKMLEKNIADMDFFKGPFIALQGLFLEKLEKIEKVVEQQGLEPTGFLEGIRNGSFGGNVSVDDEKKDAVEKLAHKFSAEELEKISEKRDKILDKLNDDEEAQESMIRPIIGYIGELMYKKYLQDLNKDYLYAALEGIGEYDFENKTDKIYIDVKTTLQSLEDGKAPFYLHYSQNDFMKSHPDAKYRIVRISLTDFGLEKEYVKLREKYGVNAEPINDENLGNECKEIVNKNWTRIRAKFLEIAHEYAISRILMKD